MEYWLYKLAGCPERALQDEDWGTRREAYRALGFTEEALKDEAWGIRREASDYFKAKALLLERYPNLEDMPPLLIGDDKFLKLYAETRLEKGV